MKKAAFILLVLLATGGGVYLTLPPQPRILATSPAIGVRGAIHVHTKRSDGSGAPEQVAAAAARAGLQFIILTDHGDATRTPTRPAYQSGVLVVDAVEISGDDGHVVALGLPKTPYPLGGEVRDIVEDVERLGAMSVAAHPGSPKPGLRWTEWASPFSGLEWLNGDSESRDERWFGLARALFTYPFRATASLATLLDRPDAVLRRWDALTGRRRVVAVAGADAHARLDVRGDESGGRLAMLPIPGYETMFRAFSVTAVGFMLTRDPERDSAAILDAIRHGRMYSTIDALATPAVVSFSAVQGGMATAMGDFVLDTGGDIDLRVDSNAPPGSHIVLMKDGAAMATADGPSLRRVVRANRAVYRVEIQLDGAPGSPPVPWVVTNPIYVRAHDETPAARGSATETAPQYENGEARGWRVEISPRSKAALNVVRTLTGTELKLRWALGGTKEESPYAAFAMPAGQEIGRYDRLMFTARADQPMRLSVQFRLSNGDRWRRSVYLDQTAREISVFFDDVRAAGQTAQPQLTVASVRDVLFVVDTINARPGGSGQFWIDDVKYGR
jgi:hypothetical protein